jgi:hypothetical protein
MQIAMEKADVARAEQEEVEEMWRQDERAQQEWEWVEKEAELDDKKAEYIWQVNAKEINEVQFRELVVELDMERAMGESVVEGPATMQDEEVRESEWDESVEEEPEAANKVIESSTVSKGKWKVAPTRAKVFSEVDRLVSDSAKVVINRQLVHHAHSAAGASHGRRS